MGACLRLIRPMQQDAAFIGGKIVPGSAVYIQRFDIPVEIGVPAVQRLFRLRNRDVTRLQKGRSAFYGSYAWRLLEVQVFG